MQLSAEDIKALAANDRAMDEGLQPFVRDDQGNRWSFNAVVLERCGCVSGQTVCHAVLSALLEASVEHLRQLMTAH